MDLSAFSKENFEPKMWLNNAFELPEAQNSKEEFAANLVTKLQSLIQEVSISLERTAEQVIQNLPKITHEVETLKHEATLLKEQMDSVKAEVMKVERDSSESMATLLKIEHVKSCMQEASKALREADNWSTLSADVDEVFERGDISAISAKLIGMQNSLEILADVPDYKERSQRLECLKDSLEAMISPQLIAAFSSQSNDVAMIYMKIFKDIKRLHRLQKYYHNFQKSQLLEQWKQIIESDSEDNLIDWLNNFYDVLLSTWHSQMGVCNQLLLEIPSVEVLSELLVDTLSSMDPSLEFCIEAALKQQKNSIQFLIELKQITDRLAKSLDVSIQATDPNYLKNVHVVVLAQTIYGPYRPHIEQYAVLEERNLIASLNTLKFDSSDIEDNVRLLGESVSKIFFFVQEADNRCHALTHGCAYPSLFQSLKGFFREYVNTFKKVCSLLKRSTKNRSGKLGSDWTSFQQSLHAMQISGEMLLQLESLEQLLKSNLREIGRKLSYFAIPDADYMEKVRNPFHAYDDILLSHTLKRDLQQGISYLQEGNDFSPLGETLQLYRKVCSEMGSVIMDSVLDQIKPHFQNLPLMKVWSDEKTGTSLVDLPTFSLSPLEYVTEVGQFLMTIPQHIEPFIIQDNPALYVALRYFESVSSVQDVGNVADYLLEHLAHGISKTYLENLLKIGSLTPISTKQLITDIGYLCDVLDDIGITPLPDMQYFVQLLKANPEEFSSSLVKDMPTALVNTVKTMRKIR